MMDIFFLRKYFKFFFDVMTSSIILSFFRNDFSWLTSTFNSKNPQLKIINNKNWFFSIKIILFSAISMELSKICCTALNLKIAYWYQHRDCGQVSIVIYQNAFQFNLEYLNEFIHLQCKSRCIYLEISVLSFYCWLISKLV